MWLSFSYKKIFPKPVSLDRQVIIYNHYWFITNSWPQTGLLSHRLRINKKVLEKRGKRTRVLTDRILTWRVGWDMDPNRYTNLTGVTLHSFNFIHWSRNELIFFFQWTDPEGKWHFTFRPCDHSTDSTHLLLLRDPSSGSSTSLGPWDYLECLPSPRLDDWTLRGDSSKCILYLKVK